jgi:hypothetical protein
MTTPSNAPTQPPPRITVVRSKVGWELREERAGKNGAVIHTAHFSDWHRLERAKAKFERQAAAAK